MFLTNKDDVIAVLSFISLQNKDALYIKLQR